MIVGANKHALVRLGLQFIVTLSRATADGKFLVFWVDVVEVKGGEVFIVPADLALAATFQLEP